MDFSKKIKKIEDQICGLLQELEGEANPTEARYLALTNLSRMIEKAAKPLRKEIEEKNSTVLFPEMNQKVFIKSGRPIWNWKISSLFWHLAKKFRFGDFFSIINIVDKRMAELPDYTELQKRYRFQDGFSKSSVMVGYITEKDVPNCVEVEE